MRVLGGDFGTGAAILDTNLAGTQLTQVRIAKGLTGSYRYSAAQIGDVQQVTEDNKRSLLGAVGGGVVGAVLAGPVGAIVGGLLSGKSREVVVLVTFRDGKRMLGVTSPEKYHLLLAATMLPEPKAKEPPMDWSFLD